MGGQCFWAFQSIPCSPLSIFWLLNRLSWPLSQSEIKHRILGKTVNVLHSQQKIVEEMVSWLEASRRAVTSPMIVSHHYRLTSNCIMWYVYTSLLHAATYITQSFLLIRPIVSLKRRHSLINIQTSSCTTVRNILMLIISISTWRKGSKLVLLSLTICLRCNCELI